MKVLLLMLAVPALAGGCAPAPPAESVFVPEDLAATLPTEVRGKMLTVAATDPASMGLLEFDQLGVEASDLLGASALHREGENELSILALRARGLPAKETVAPLLTLLPPFQPAVVDDREILASFPSNPPGLGPRASTYLYLKGEVVYVIDSLNANLEQAKADADAVLEGLP